LDSRDGDNTVAEARTIQKTLSQTETDALLHRWPRASGANIQDALLTALAQAFRTCTGAGALLVDLETHGREPLFEDLDISRTIGWFTALFPVLLDPGPENAGQALGIAAIRASLRQIPQNGIEYGLLRYLHGDEGIAAELAALHRAELSFDYLGQMDPAASPASRFAWTRESAGTTRSPRDRRRHFLEVAPAGG